MTPCMFDDCLNPQRGLHGLCNGHRIQRRKGQPLRQLGTWEPERPVCTLPDCDRPNSRHGLCSMHARRLSKTGSTDDPRSSVAQRFVAKIDVRAPAECWPWTAALDRDGYGRFQPGAGSRKAHRLAYEHFVGDIPPGLVIDHTCHNRDMRCVGGSRCPHRRCCNPSHLALTTIGENVTNGRMNDRRKISPADPDLSEQSGLDAGAVDIVTALLVVLLVVVILVVLGVV